MTTSILNQERLWTPQFIALLTTAIFMYLVAFMLNPTMPLIAQSVGLTDPSVGGILVFAYTLGSLLPRVMWGSIADRKGRRAVYVIGLIIMIVCVPIIPMISVLTGLVIVRFIMGTGFSATSTSGGTMAADLVPESRRAEGIGYYALANTVGMAMGPAIGTYLIQIKGVTGILFACAISGIISLGLSFFIRYEKNLTKTRNPKQDVGIEKSNETKEVATGKSQSSKMNWISKGFYTDSAVLKIALVGFFVIFPYGGIIGYIISYGTSMGIANIGMYFTVYALSVFSVRIFAGKFSDRYGATTVLIPSILMIAFGMGILYFATSFLIFVISAVCFGFGLGAAIPVLQATAYNYCPPERRGAVSATLFGTMDLAYGLGAVFLGFGVQAVGYAPAFVGTALVELIGLVVLLVVLRPELNKLKTKDE